MDSEEKETNRQREVLFRDYARGNNAEGLRGLLVDEALVQRMRPSGANLMGTAAEWGNRAVLELLVEQGFPLNERGNQGEALLNACRGRVSEEETLSTVDYLLKNGADPNPTGLTPLHFAARFGFARVAERLLQAGADPISDAYCQRYTKRRMGAGTSFRWNRR
ncbi:MAG: ankyrin repeat domain-containing protein [Fibrella sp.]|nr:ankyrin repeat domain-containing protein [Armatimonadota bacterium]